MPGNSLKSDMDRTVRYYSSLFTLPSINTVLILYVIMDVLSGIIAFLPLNLPNFGFPSGLLFGFTFLSITLLTDLLIHYYLLRTDPIFSLRRCFLISFFSSFLWLAFIILGAFLSSLLGSPYFWFKLFLLGFCGVLILRLVIFSTVSSASYKVVSLSALLQPILCCLPLSVIGTVVGYRLEVRFLLFIFFAIPFSLLAVFIFVVSVNNKGRKILGIPTLSLFRAFLANWMEDLNAPLENILEKYGCVKEVKISFLAFNGNNSLKTVIVVPSIHSGPFKNVGSSTLPYMIQTTLESNLQCIISVPHGLCGHELDLASQHQNQKVLKSILDSMNFSTFKPKATPFVQTRINEANASCQIFGKCALFTLTIAPKTTVDLPAKLGSTLLYEAKKRGLSSVIIIDAHNSINGPFDVEEAVNSLTKAAVMALEMALLQNRSPFKVGVAKTIPQEFSLKEGLGPGGICVLIVKVGNQKTAYITIDGNNMVSGLREKILLNLQELGISSGEILTTDTHMVSSVVLTKRGYHPIGAVMDHQTLINYIRKATINASNNLEIAESSCSTLSISGVKTIGEKQLGDLFLIINETIKLSKRLALSIFSFAGMLLILILALL